jgi:hypothetical protein
VVVGAEWWWRSVFPTMVNPGERWLGWADDG